MGWLCLRNPLIASFLLLITHVAGQATAPSDICGRVFNSTELFVDAVDAYSCLISTPFRPDVAKDLLDYWRTTLEFQSTLAYLKDPPRAYQQPSIDIVRSLDLLRADIDTGVFSNQYAFEAAVQDIFYAAHDGHLGLQGSIMGVFEFGAPFEFTTVSLDGKEIPKIYFRDDALAWASRTGSQPSAVTKINGQVAEDFLAVFASHNSVGYVEPHGDWNGIMYTPASDILGSVSALNMTIFYPGDKITVEFANGTSQGPVPWRAYNIQGYAIPNLNTGEQFYEYFVLGQYNGDDSTDPTGGDVDSSGDSNTEGNDNTDDGGDYSDNVVTGWTDIPAYPPTADVYSPDLGYGGYVTGYFLNESKTGVLSIPTFQEFGDSAETFSSTVGEFLKRSKQAGMTKIVVDLQQNSGGSQLLATDLFRQFFPGVDPFSGMRTRSFDLSNELGVTFTNVFTNNASSFNETFFDAFIGDPFVVSTELNAGTNKNFTSWAEYYGPHPDHNDQFSTVFRYNLSSSIFDEAAAGIVIYGYGNRSRADPQPYDAKDIVLLTDASCGSTCDLFVEMMHHEVAVRTVVVGGLPQYGPMQARGGTRGAFSYSTDDIDGDMMFGCAANSTLCGILPNRSSSDAVQQSSLSVNLADQIRPMEYTPLQFTYEAADCRIFWTPQTVNNFTALWLYAATAAFSNASLCVEHSAEHNNTMHTDTWGPSDEQKAAWASTNPAYVPPDNKSVTTTEGLAQIEYGAGIHEASLYADAVINKPCGQLNKCGNVNQYRCRLVETCIQGGNGQASFSKDQICRMPCSPRAVRNSCPYNFPYCRREVTFTNGWKDYSYYCGPRERVGDQQCAAKVFAATAPPIPIDNKVNNEPVDVRFE